jgi:hypothetical protein
MHFRRKTIVGEIITYIGVRVGIRVVPRRSSLDHEAQPGEVTQCCTCSGYDLLDVLLLVVPEVILLLVVILVGVVVLVGVVILLPPRTVGDEVGDVATLEATPRVSGTSSSLLKPVHRPKFPSKQGNLVIGNALILLIESYRKRRQRKLQENFERNQV